VTQLFPSGAIDLARRQYMRTMTQRANVYLRNPATGRNDLLARADLPCRLTHVRSDSAGNAGERSQLNALRRLVWDGSYVLPENSVVLIDGINWRPSPGTFANYLATDGTSIYRACDATRQTT
jgi:hypothetical protein